MTVKRVATLVGMLAVLVGLIGCGSPTVYPVKGRITFEGKPMVGGGSILFVPTGNQAGKTAAGDVAADGTYQLMTHRPGDGSMSGEFRVVIIQVVEREPERSNDGEKPGQAVSVVAPADRIPRIYSDHYNSPLRGKVEAKSLNELDFDLKRGAGAPERPKDARGEGLPLRWLALIR